MTGTVAGTLPASWGAAGSLPALTDLYIRNNTLISGPLPDSWGGPSAFQQLIFFQLVDSNITGTLKSLRTVVLQLFEYLSLAPNGIQQDCKEVVHCLNMHLARSLRLTSMHVMTIMMKITGEYHLQQ